MSSSPEEIVKDSQITEVIHLVVSLSYYEKDGEMYSITDINANKTVSVEQAIGILETAKFMLLTGDGTHLTTMGAGEADTELN